MSRIAVTLTLSLSLCLPTSLWSLLLFYNLFYSRNDSVTSVLESCSVESCVFAVGCERVAVCVSVCCGEAAWIRNDSCHINWTATLSWQLYWCLFFFLFLQNPQFSCLRHEKGMMMRDGIWSKGKKGRKKEHDSSVTGRWLRHTHTHMSVVSATHIHTDLQTFYGSSLI